MLWDKGVGDVVEAFLSLTDENRGRLILAGKLDLANPSGISEAQLKEWANHPDIEWRGHVNDMNSLYNESDVVCLPSYGEGLPMALLEASLCEKLLSRLTCRVVIFLFKTKLTESLFPQSNPINWLWHSRHYGRGPN